MSLPEDQNVADGLKRLSLSDDPHSKSGFAENTVLHSHSDGAQCAFPHNQSYGAECAVPHSSSDGLQCAVVHSQSDGARCAVPHNQSHGEECAVPEISLDGAQCTVMHSQFDGAQCAILHSQSNGAQCAVLHSKSDFAQCAVPNSQSDVKVCCKSKECLKTISSTIKESCHQQAKAHGRVLYVSRYIYPHVEGPPDTKQSFIYKVPDETGQEIVVCQKAFKRVFGISQYNLQQAQGAAIKRTKGKDKEVQDEDATDAKSPQPKKSSGFFRRLSRSFSKRLHSGSSSSKTKVEQEKEEVIEIQQIKYDLRKAKISKESQILGKFNQINNTQCQQTATWKTSQTRTTSRTYEWHWGDQSSISAEAEFTIGLPVIAEGEVGISAEQTILIGNKQVVSNAETDTWEFDLPGTVQAMSELTIKLVAEKGRVSIPVVATLKRHGKVWKEEGVYVGTQCLNAKVIYE